jgi:hypothetical protein
MRPRGERDVIIAFNLKGMRMSEITLLDDFDVSYSFGIQYHLLVIGRLINAWIVDMETVKIWAMQEYGVQLLFFVSILFRTILFSNMLYKLW